MPLKNWNYFKKTKIDWKIDTYPTKFQSIAALPILI